MERYLEECLDERIFNYELIMMCSNFIKTRNALSKSCIIKNRSSIIKSIIEELISDSNIDLDIMSFCEKLVKTVNTRMHWKEAKSELESIIVLCEEIKLVLNESRCLFSKPTSLLYNCTMCNIIHCQMSIKKILET